MPNHFIAAAWQLLADNAEAITAIATCIGVVGVVWQLRAAGRVLRSAAYQGVVSHSLTLIENILDQDATLSAFGRQMTEPGETPPNPENLRWHFMALATIRHFENLHVQHELGSLNDGQWEGYRALLKYYLELEGFKEWWSKSRNRGWFSQAFRDMVTAL